MLGLNFRCVGVKLLKAAHEPVAPLAGCLAPPGPQAGPGHFAPSQCRLAMRISGSQQGIQCYKGFTDMHPCGSHMPEKPWMGYIKCIKMFIRNSNSKYENQKIMHFLCDSQKGTAFENQVLLPISTIPTNFGATLATFCTGWFRPRCPPESPCGKTRQSFQSTSVVVVATEFSSATGICRTSGPASHVSPPCAVQHVRACKRMHIRKQVDHAINKSSTYSNQWKNTYKTKAYRLYIWLSYLWKLNS